jgi:MYXO-CTERM domain-containing protein
LNRRRLLAFACGLVLSSGARPAGAYTIASGFTGSCHERLALTADAVLLGEMPLDDVTVPTDGLWRDVAAQLAPALLDSAGLAAAATLTDAQQFVLFSVVVGIRSPDTGGHSVSNLDDLRRAQVDPSPDSQYVHCLRAPPDDGFAGDVATLQGAEALIRAALTDAAAAAGPARTHTFAPFYLDFYGQLEVEVDAPAYLIGRAMHTLQDCYAHTLRSPDAATVFSVLNYLEAVEGRLDEPRDGMAHSDTMDDCRRTELAPVVDRATAVSTALAYAAVALARSGDGSLLDKGFSPCPIGETQPASCAWIFYNPDCAPPDVAACCSPANAYCGSPFLSVAREKLTQPYVKEVLSCAATGPAGPSPAVAWLGLVALAALMLWLRRRGRARPSGRAAALLLAVAIPSGRAAAEETLSYRPGAFFVAAEGHASLLSDAPERSFINATLGYGARGGYRFGRWGVVAQIERNYWLPTELSHDLAPGALNIGVGAEWFLANGRVRLGATAGPSILWFDATFDDKGTVGIFADLRPAGLRWRLGQRLAVAFDPLSVALVAPVLGTPGILQLEYRTLLGLELIP